MSVTLRTVRTYKITMMSNEVEKVDAVAWKDIGDTWIDFFDGAGQILRLRQSEVFRIEVDRS